MTLNNDKLLIIFVKNPEAGKVKTRLAAAVGNERACEVYKNLLSYTVETASRVSSRRQVWYSSFIDRSDNVDENVFEKYQQTGRDLGERMCRAFEGAFNNGCERVVIIGSDCPGLTPQIIEEAFEILKRSDVVVGPSEDGGYYLLGMSSYNPELFSDIEWSTDRVLPDTVRVLEKKKLSYQKLGVLNDIDTEEDLKSSRFYG